MSEFEKNQKADRRKRIIINLIYMAGILAIIIFLCRFAFANLLPFILAFAVAAVLRPLLKLIHKKLSKIPEKAISVLLIILFYLTIGAVVVLVSIRLFAGITELVSAIPDFWANTLQPTLADLAAQFTKILANMNIQVSLSINDIFASLGNAVSSLSSWLLTSMSNMVISAPNFLIGLVICIASTFFILMDWDKIGGFIKRQLPDRANYVIQETWKTLGHTVWTYAKTYGLILLITYAEMFLGLWIMGVDNFALYALFLAILDVLPVIGSGIVLIPWCIVGFVQGDLVIGIGMAILYIVFMIVKNAFEPKLVGKLVGIHPLLTLVAMITGAAVFGAIGFLGLPIAIVVIQELNNKGVIHLFK